MPDPVVKPDTGPELSFDQLFLDRWFVVLYSPPGGPKVVRMVAARPEESGGEWTVRLFGHRKPVPLADVLPVEFAVGKGEEEGADHA